MSDNIHKINTWHEEAMDFAEMAFFAGRRSEQYSYWKYIQRALNYEKAAARLLKDIDDSEPSRSVLYQGAVHFALNLDNFEEAKILLAEALEGNPPAEIREDLELQLSLLGRREKIRNRIADDAQKNLSYLEDETDPEREDINHALNAAITGAEAFLGKQIISQLLNRPALQVLLESKNLVSNPNYQIFENQKPNEKWVEGRGAKITWNFWKAYKEYLDHKGIAASTITKLDHLTDDILNRIGDPNKPGVWDKRGMVVGDVQSGKTSNYIGLINKAADAGFRIIIILSGLYENLRQQTQQRVDEGFSGFMSAPGSNSEIIGVGKHRKSFPVHPITHTKDGGDLRASSLRNLPLNTNDYYAIVIKKNASVLKNLLTWLYARGEKDGEYQIIKNIPLLIIDDEADYASINVDKDFVSRINGYIRSTLGLFEQSAFIGYTATPFANIFMSDPNDTEGKDIIIDGKKFRLGDELFPRDFIINIPPPSNYIGYTKVFDTETWPEAEEESLPLVNEIDDFEPYIPQTHRKDDDLPAALPPSLEYAVYCFIIVCAVRIARGREKEHNSMLVHVSWYVIWINRVALLINTWLSAVKDSIRYDQGGAVAKTLKEVWEKEYKGRTHVVAERLGYDDPRLIDHDWDEILPFLCQAAEKIEVRAVHGAQRGLPYDNTTPLNYHEYDNGLSVIAVGGNKLSRGLTLEGLSVSYFLRATKFYDTLLQMGRWFGYRSGYADVCRLFTTEELITWYQYIGNATDELKEQFDIMNLADRIPRNFGFKVRSAPGMLMISAAAKIKGATDLNLSYSGELLETYIISKDRDTLRKNLSVIKELVTSLPALSGKVRQGQSYIWENIPFKPVDAFLEHYLTKQSNIRPDFIRSYIANQVRKGNLINWTIVLISNSSPQNSYELATAESMLEVGLTKRQEAIHKKNGVETVDPVNYIIRQSHIISPPHEYLDMEESDERYLKAKDETIQNSRSRATPKNPGGKYVRKYRGSQNALLIIYLLDPTGFNGDKDLPATGYAIGLPQIEGDTKLPYKVNDVFMQELFSYPEDAEENPETEDEI
ncbi:hypothetical protein A3860_29865 [Niastella vici]|uniref:Putative endonuclease Z1 domain-containing protein n=1 Tax=Niastella vici TaxID=1703345 RepID=A0A1V9FU69_9BACT|nr:Z1 domain-containing protein [Niastella vici]OQP61905.1 hypothetical protein A3860_29865 [Niastella vici]